MKNSTEGLKGRHEPQGKQKSVNLSVAQLKLFSSRNNMKQNPLAVRRAKETMFQQQLNRMQMTTKKNAQTIHELRTEKDDLIVLLI